MASNLSGSELYKYEWRTAIFLRKFTQREAFTLQDGKEVFLVPDEDVISAVNNRRSTMGLRLLTSDGHPLKFSDLKKTPEFGGKDSRHGIAVEDRELRSLIDQIDAAKTEEASSTLLMKLRHSFVEVFSAESTPKVPKSDFHLTDTNGKAIWWISHKSGSKPTDFLRWGGVSEVNEPLLARHHETKKFYEDLKALFPDGLPPRTTIKRKIKDRRLKMLSVYGNKFGGIHGENNVSMLLQGPVKLIKHSSSSRNYYSLGANHVHYNGDSVSSGGYDPVFTAVYRTDRSNGGVKFCEISLAPELARKGVYI